MRWLVGVTVATLALLALMTGGVTIVTAHGLESPPTWGSSGPPATSVGPSPANRVDRLPPTLPLGMACRPTHATDIEPLAPGGPLHGSGIERMTPVEIDAVLAGTGYCYSFRFVYQYLETYPEGYSEYWCSPPPGSFEAALYDEAGTIVVIIRDYALWTPRPQPSAGWDCER